MITLLHKIAAEFVGTFFLVFMGCGAILTHTHAPEAFQASGIPWAFGLTVAGMIYSVSHISGAHFNPAVTLAFTSMGRFPKKDVLPYLLAQVSGGIAGAMVLSFLFPTATDLGTTLPTLSLVNAAIWEFILTFLLMFVICAVATDLKAKTPLAGWIVGMTIVVCAWVGGPHSGASMNPARSIGPALISGRFESLWLYLSIPVLGAVLAAQAYRFFSVTTKNRSA